MLQDSTLKSLLVALVISWGLPSGIAAAMSDTVQITANAANVLETGLESIAVSKEIALREAKIKRKWKTRSKIRNTHNRNYNYNKNHRHYNRHVYKKNKRIYRNYPRYRDPGRYIIPGIIIGGIIANEIYRDYGALPRAHYNWCYARYRSYRAYDNSFQPYHGPRRQCISPYWP